MATFAVTFVLAAFVFAALYVAFWICLQITHDAREPPMIETKLPYITPMRLVLDNKYFINLREQYKTIPIFTLRIAQAPKIYVINDPHLIAAVQRQPKFLTFQAISDKYSTMICDLSPKAIALAERETSMWLQHPAASSPTGAIFKALQPGQDLLDLERSVLHHLDNSCKSWVPIQASVRTGLYSWVKEVIAISSTEAIYGPVNPYGNAVARNHFWTYYAGLKKMSLGIGPLFAKDSIASRNILASDFERYFSKGGHHQASALCRQRAEWYMNRGFSLRDFAQIEVGNGIAILSNTVPTAFWLVLHVLSDPKASQACRDELLQHVVETKNAKGVLVRALDIMALKTSCPTIQSAFKEALRVHSNAVITRGAVQDHLLNGEYLLRKDSIVFMPAAVQHYDHTRWGPDAAEYHYDRFIRHDRSRINNGSFRAFGAGASLCPGRRFVMLEILTFAAMILLRFEMRPTSGKWTMPTTAKAAVLTEAMPGPDHDVEVEIRRRADDEGVEWAWKLGECRNDFASEIGSLDYEKLDERITGGI